MVESTADVELCICQRKYTTIMMVSLGTFQIHRKILEKQGWKSIQLNVLGVCRSKVEIAKN